MQEDKKRTWAEIKMSEIGHNYQSICESLPKNCKIMGLVKADAYGHGAIQVSAYLEQMGCDYLAVACVDEAEKLRFAGNKLPIIVLGATPEEFTKKLLDFDLIQAVGSLEMARAYSREAEKYGGSLRVHLKLDTGMGRMGFGVRHGGIDEVLHVLRLPVLEAEGIFTHFAVSDEPEGEAFTKEQLSIFLELVGQIEGASGHRFAIRHCANSGAVLNYPETYLDMIRPGLILYGLYPGENQPLRLNPVMELKSRVTAVYEHEKGDTISYGRTFTAEKKMRVAVLPIGYADGLPRCLSGKIDVLLHGVRCPQIGRICMDMCMVDVTDLPEARTGDVATIFGNDGSAVIPVSELAEKAGTISYEIVCGISPRVPRVYIL